MHAPARERGGDVARRCQAGDRQRRQEPQLGAGGHHLAAVAVQRGEPRDGLAGADAHPRVEPDPCGPRHERARRDRARCPSMCADAGGVEIDDAAVGALDAAGERRGDVGERADRGSSAAGSRRRTTRSAATARACATLCTPGRTPRARAGGRRRRCGRARRRRSATTSGRPVSVGIGAARGRRRADRERAGTRCDTCASGTSLPQHDGAADTAGAAARDGQLRRHAFEQWPAAGTAAPQRAPRHHLESERGTRVGLPGGGEHEQGGARALRGAGEPDPGGARIPAGCRRVQPQIERNQAEATGAEEQLGGAKCVVEPAGPDPEQTREQRAGGCRASGSSASSRSTQAMISPRRVAPAIDPAGETGAARAAEAHQLRHLAAGQAAARGRRRDRGTRWAGASEQIRRPSRAARRPDDRADRAGRPRPTWA